MALSGTACCMGMGLPRANMISLQSLAATRPFDIQICRYTEEAKAKACLSGLNFAANHLKQAYNSGVAVVAVVNDRSSDEYATSTRFIKSEDKQNY
jgi:ActR/RegA family two-component response regulator